MEQTAKEFYQLLKKIRVDSHKGLREFYHKYGKLIYSTARSICKCPYKTDEVVNDVLIRVWQFSFKKEAVENPAGWVYVITLNSARTAIKEKEIFPFDDNVGSHDKGFEEFFAKDSFLWLISELSETEQKVLTLRCVSQLTFEEIAKAVGSPTSSISSICYRAQQKIKAKIEKIADNA